jgi:Domain of unknown function (DUF5664)
MKDEMSKKIDESGGYISVDRTDALKENWDLIQRIKPNNTLKVDNQIQMTIIKATEVPKPLDLPSVGVKYDDEKPMMALVPPLALQQIAMAFTKGAAKYGQHNYLKGGLAYTRMLSASMRHITAFIAGEDLDPETKVPHWACACANLMMMGEHVMRGNKKDDDRFKSTEE